MATLPALTNNQSNDHTNYTNSTNEKSCSKSLEIHLSPESIYIFELNEISSNNFLIKTKKDHFKLQKCLVKWIAANGLKTEEDYTYWVNEFRFNQGFNDSLSVINVKDLERESKTDEDDFMRGSYISCMKSPTKQNSNNQLYQKDPNLDLNFHKTKNDETKYLANNNIQLIDDSSLIINESDYLKETQSQTNGNTVQNIHMQDGIYNGELKDGKRSGFGTFIYDNGGFYKGQFHNDKLSGEGIYIYPDSRKYAGSFVNNLYDGYGEFTNPDGRWYKGDWKEGEMHGIGERHDFDGCWYKGAVRNNKLHGFGEKHERDGTWYKGEFKDNKKYGEGEIN